MNVIGPDGQFYQPTPGRLFPYSLTGQWPKTGKGNREGKAPIRYLGRFFYMTGEVQVAVPAGRVRIEAWKGFEYRPAEQAVEITAGQISSIVLELERTAPMAALGYYSGDMHLHFPRKTESDDEAIFDLLEAEDICFGSLLAYNEPAGPYTGKMEMMDSPQFRGLGKASVQHRGMTWIVSGQEYRSMTYGHLNLYWSDDLVLNGQKTNANNWPLYGQLGRDTIRLGGFALYAHGGYNQAIALTSSRETSTPSSSFSSASIGESSWLAGTIFSISAIASPVWDRATTPPAALWVIVKRMCTYKIKLTLPSGSRVRRRDEVSSPRALCSCSMWTENGQGESSVRPAAGSHRVRARVRVTSEVAAVQFVQLIINGKIVHEQAVPAGKGLGSWIELDRSFELSRSSWIAARAFGRAPSGSPDAEAHTNPVYVDIDGKAPYDRDSLDRLVLRLDQQMTVHRKRSFAEKAQVLDYFEKSRDILLRIRQAGSLPASGVPDDWINETTTATFDSSRRTHTDRRAAKISSSHCRPRRLMRRCRHSKP